MKAINMSDQLLSSGQLLLFTERYNLQRRSQGTALILCLLLGAIGGHKFYLRKNIAGVLYLLFCWSFIPAILSIADLFLVSSQVRRYNNLQAVEILHSINPQADPELLTIYNKYENKFLIYLGRILAISAGVCFFAEMYLAIMADIQPSELLKTQWSNINLSRAQLNGEPVTVTHKYYMIKYDGLSLNSTLSDAQAQGYNQCNHNQYYTVCSSTKNNYPYFVNFPIKFAILQFDNQNKLIMFHLYLNSAATYKAIISALSAEAHGGKRNTTYLTLAGSHEEIIVNQSESSIQIGDREVLMNYDKSISREKILNDE
jgi:TM2 domain-containing membrane protein YozV